MYIRARNIKRRNNTDLSTFKPIKLKENNEDELRAISIYDNIMNAIRISTMRKG